MDLNLTKPLRWPYLLLIGAIHGALFFAWTDTTVYKKANEPSSALFVVLIPGNALVVPQKKDVHESESKPAFNGQENVLKHHEQKIIASSVTVIKNEKIAKTKTTNAPVNTPMIATESQARPTAPASQAMVDKGLNTDITNITKGLKTDFEARDRVTLKPPASPMSKLGQKIAAAATTQREGYHEERVLLGDGRPVTKVITPYGTYCILHRKPGEIIGNELAAVPVTCGNL